MVTPLKAPGANPTVVSAEAVHQILLNENGRTFMSWGDNRSNTIEFSLPSVGLVEGFRVRIGVNSAGRPVKITNGDISIPRSSSLLTTGSDGTTHEHAAELRSYDPGAFLDLIWDPNGDNKWRIISGAGLWVEPLSPVLTAEFHLIDPPAARKVDFGKPSATGSEWKSIPCVPKADGGTFQYLSAYEFEVPSTQEMFDTIRPGLPVRWLDGDGTKTIQELIEYGWRYGVVTAFEASDVNTDQAKVTISGAPLLVVGPFTAPLAVEIGPQEALRRITLTFSGNFNNGSDAEMIKNQNQTFLNWTEGDAALVRVGARCIKADTGWPPDINVSIGGNDVLSPPIGADTAWAYSAYSVQLGYYQVAFDDAIEVSVTNHGGGNGGPSTGDAEDLTVELIFVQARRHAFWNHDDVVNPTLNMVISGLGIGTWAGVGDGVHAVTPTAYAINDWAMTTKTTTTGYSYYSLKSERWTFRPGGTTGTQFLQFRAWGKRAVYTTGTPIHGPTTGWSSFSLHRNTSAFTGAYNYSGVTGFVRNTYMGSIILGGVTFTWWKLGDTWGSAFN